METEHHRRDEHEHVCAAYLEAGKLALERLCDILTPKAEGNCPNCGAPHERTIRCTYCGTWRE